MENKTNIKVLVVDDEADLREVIAKRFKIYGYEVFTAESGNKAIEMLKTTPVHIIISDIKMPDGTGVDLIQHIRKTDWKFPKLFFISGFSSVTVDELYNFGADGFFSKPFDTKSLLNTIRSASLSIEEKYSSPFAEPILQKFSLSQIDISNPDSQIKFGRGGILLKSDKFFPNENANVDFEITLKSGESLKFVGKNRWSRLQKQNNLPTGGGFEIVHADKVTCDWLKKYIEETKPIAYIPMS